jgi:D-alanyl-D-alanine carboxypeptidase
MTKRRIFLLALFTLFLFSTPAKADSQKTINKFYKINIDAATIKKGYTVTAFDNALKLSLVPGILSSSTDVEIVQLNEDLETPWRLKKISDFYQFEFKNKLAYDNHKPFYIQFDYTEEDDSYKQVFFYDKNHKSWRPLPTKDFPDENFVRSLIHLPFARIAVFSYSETLTNGKASWYAYKPGNFAASPDYPKGSILRVHNKENDKFVDIEVNDYGPDRSLFPDRVIDLEKNAFSALASLGAGTIDVLIEPLIIKENEEGNILEVPEGGINNVINISAKAAIVFDEKQDKILFEKNKNAVLPLASLTKLVAMKVFMETNPDLSKTIKYDDQDKELNYEFCERKYSIASLRIDHGATATIKDFLYTSIVGSANNTIETLVRNSGMARKDFLIKMNQKVLEWGASSTKFFDPTGLSPDNVSTVYDYALISKEVLADPTIQDASITKLYEFYTSDSNIIHKIRNTNNIVRYSRLNNVSGSKTGYLIEAEHCLMTRIETKNGPAIAITFAVGDRETSILETEKLLKFAKNVMEK